MLDTGRSVIETYFNAFNAGDREGMLNCLSNDIEHHVNEGKIRHGKEAFAEFLAHMDRCYAEQLTDMVIFVNDEATRGAAEFIVNGTYKETDEGLPEAQGQTYRLPAGSFFTLKDGQISRVVTYYNLADWIRQVS
jgi:steroid delta-isomerase-like uncharacterized protein